MASTRKSSRQGVIRLGHTRSPKKKCPSNFENTEQLDSKFTSHDETPPLYQTLQPNIQLHREKSLMTMSYNQGMKKVSEIPTKKSPMKPKLDQQASPHSKVVVYHRPSPQVKLFTNQMNKQIENQPNIIHKKLQNREQQLMRKNRILQQRISELHHQKQTCVLKMNQENRRLSYDVENLKNEMSHLFDIKNKQIEVLKNELYHNSKAGRPTSSSKGIKSHNSLKNDVYVENDKEDIATSILKIKKEVCDESVISEKYEKQEIGNIQYKRDSKHEISHSEQKQTIDCAINTSVNEVSFLKSSKTEKHEDDLIPEYMKKIEELQTLNHSVTKENTILREELEELKRTIIENSELIQKNNQDIVERYESQIMKMREKVQELTEQITQRDYKLDSIIEEKQKIELDSFKFNESFKQKFKEYQSEKGQLQNQVKSLEGQIQILTPRERLQQGIQTSSDSVAQQCYKCKEIMKTFLKLNSKTYQK